MVFPAFLPQVEPSVKADTLNALVRVGPILVQAKDVQAVATKLEAPDSAHIEWFVECETTEEVENSLSCLGGKVVVSSTLASQLDAETRKNVVVRAAESTNEKVDGLAGIVCSRAIEKDQVKSLQKSLIKPGLVFSSAAEAADGTTIPVISAASMTPQDVAQRFTAGLVTDRPDGLYPTIVSSPSTNPAPLSLGLVYSSLESISESIVTGRGVYQSRKHGLWRKGETSGSTQQVVKIRSDCDKDALLFEVVQTGTGFCHLETEGCFSYEGHKELQGIRALEKTLQSRLASAPEGSYTARLFNDPTLLSQKIMEEAEELTEAKDKDHVAFEMADLIYFAMARCVKAGVSFEDVERNLDEKANKGKKGIRRQGDAKQKWIDYTNKSNKQTTTPAVVPAPAPVKSESTADAPVPQSFPSNNNGQSDDATQPMIRMRTSDLSSVSTSERTDLLQRPVMDSSAMIERVKPIVTKVREGGDDALKALTKQFDKADLETTTLLPPFYPPPSGKLLAPEISAAIDQAYANVKAFHAGQAETEPLVVETMPGVVCTRFARPIDRVGIYVPGGTAILPSTALMLGVPAQVAGCSTIVLATPPRADGSISPEVLYVAQLVGVNVILKAGGAQAVAAMAYGTQECPKVDKIFGPGNQWVTAAKMLVQNDTQALVGIDMPAGPSEVMVIADHTANATFVASDLLSQAEHGIDSQVVLVAISLTPEHLEAIEQEVDRQANALPRVDIIRQAIKKSLIVKVKDVTEAFDFSNEYAPEHLILHLENSSDCVKLVNNAGSVFVGAFSPER